MEIHNNKIKVREATMRNMHTGQCVDIALRRIKTDTKVKDSHHVLLCDKCELWFHIDYMEYPVSNYSTSLNFTSFIWVCRLWILQLFT